MLVLECAYRNAPSCTKPHVEAARQSGSLYPITCASSRSSFAYIAGTHDRSATRRSGESQHYQRYSRRSGVKIGDLRNIQDHRQRYTFVWSWFVREPARLGFGAALTLCVVHYDRRTHRIRTRSTRPRAHPAAGSQQASLDSGQSRLPLPSGSL
jgi:hypothetical protein